MGIPTHSQRSNFKRILAQLDKTKAEKKILKIVAQAQTFLDEHDIGWDTISLHVPASYVLLSQRKPKKAPPAANGHAPTAAGTLSRDLLKRALVQHKDWPTVRETLDLDISRMLVADLRATAELLGIDAKFVALFTNTPDEEAGPPVTQPSNLTQEK